jgi:MerR family transcriptional regulator, light-induced transcriptional regulator
MNDQIGDSAQAPSTFRIGAVARLTGITVNTLRAWERRYGLVTPSRSGSATRLYSAGDIERLALVKRLVDDGHAIGSVAGLTLEQIHQRIKGLPPPDAEARPGRPCRVLVLGSTLVDRLMADGEVPPDPALELLGLYREPGPFLARAQDLAPDLIVLEYASIHAEDIREIGSLVARSGAARALVVYAFATKATLERLESPNVVPLRGPTDRNLLRRWCLTLQARPLVRSAWTPEPGIDLSQPLPPRRFEPSALAAIAAAAVTVRCECPHHLVDLIGGLVAFETYSQECEIRNVEDAALHALLHAVTAQARSLMETALARVVEVDGLAVP